MSITKAQLKTLRTEMQAALDNAGITDFKLEVGNMSFSPTTVNIKVAGTVKTANGEVVETPDQRIFELRVAELGLKLVNAKGQALVGYKASRPKYPFSMTGPEGGSYKCSEAQAKAMFG
jgi:hypothetical protein